MSKKSIYGWVVVEFYNSDGDLAIRGFKILNPSHATLKFYLNNQEILQSELEAFEDEFSQTFKYVFEGDLLSLNCSDLQEEFWDEAMKFWRDFFLDMDFQVGEIETIATDNGVRPHLTPDDQIRADAFEELLDYVK